MEDKILGWILRVHFLPQSNLIKFFFPTMLSISIHTEAIAPYMVVNKRAFL